MSPPDLLRQLQHALGDAYALEHELSGGGMSRVFLARDVALDRRIVIKLLDADLANSVNAERFRREIAVVARLQDPHIVPLLATGEAAGGIYYTMPFIEGESLRKRLTRDGALPVTDAVRIASDVARALVCAHRNGIVHRDIKPENILLSGDSAMVADFGIAKAIAAARTTDDTRGSHESLTTLGTAIGTPAYMAPEQVSGDRVDHRADIYALGAVLYETLCGTPPFTGRTQQAVIAAHISEPPEPIIRRRPVTPGPLATLVMQCLQKDGADRPQTAGEVLRLLVDPALAAPRSAPTVAPRLNSALRHPAAGWGAAVIALIIAAPLLTRRDAPSQPVVVTSIEPVGVQKISPGKGFALSPNGRRIAYIGASADSVYRIWVRSVDSLDAIRLDGTEGAVLPFWSPDGRRLGYFAGGMLRVRTADGEDRALCPAASPEGGSWSADDIIVFAPELRGVIRSVSAAGGKCEDLTSLSTGVLDHRRPSFLPDGRHFLYGSGSAHSIFVADTRTRVPSVVRDDIPYGYYTQPGFLLFVRNGTLFAQRFDVAHRRVQGDAHRILDHAALDAGARPMLSVTPTALLAGVSSSDDRSLTRIRRSSVVADPQLLPNGPAGTRHVAISNSGRYASIATYDGLWIYDLDRGTSTRSAATPDTGNASVGGSTWSPGDSLIAFLRTAGTDLGIQVLDVRTNRVRSLLPSEKSFLAPAAWSGDGKSIFYFTPRGTSAEAGIHVLDVATGAHKPILQRNVDASAPSLSPDGDWMAYASTQSGRSEVYLLNVRQSGAPIRVSRNGGSDVRWRGRELFYLAPNAGIVAVRVELGRQPQFSEPVTVVQNPRLIYFDVMPGGKEFIGIPSPSPASLVLVQNWQQRAR